MSNHKLAGRGSDIRGFRVRLIIAVVGRRRDGIAPGVHRRVELLAAAA